jgi:hypothetical protein
MPNCWIRDGVPVSGWFIDATRILGTFDYAGFRSKFIRSIEPIPTPEELSELRAELGRLKSENSEMGHYLKQEGHGKCDICGEWMLPDDAWARHEECEGEVFGDE